MPNRPIVSVIIPAYNAGRTICQAIDSVLQQTYAPREIIVIDDGSTDDTRGRLSGYGDKIIYLYQENQERSRARNNGIKHARGKYIAFLDADDYWAPEKLAKQVALLDRHPDLGFVFSWAAAFGNDGAVLRIMGTDFPSEGAEGMDAFEDLALRTSPPTLTVIARTECIYQAGLFDEAICHIEDWDLWLRLALRYKVGFVPESLAYYRLSGGFIPAKLDACRVQETRPQVIQKVFAQAHVLQQRQSVLALENVALARAYLNSALIDYAIGNTKGGRENLTKAHGYGPAFFKSDRSKDIVYLLTNFALNLRDTVTAPHEAKAFLETFFSNVPDPLHSLVDLRRATFRMTAAGHGFRSWTQGDPAGARRFFMRALIRYPELATNMGIWSLSIRSLRGPSGNAMQGGTDKEILVG